MYWNAVLKNKRKKSRFRNADPRGTATERVVVSAEECGIDAMSGLTVVN